MLCFLLLDIDIKISFVMYWFNFTVVPICIIIVLCFLFSFGLLLSLRYRFSKPIFYVIYVCSIPKGCPLTRLVPKIVLLLLHTSPTCTNNLPLLLPLSFRHCKPLDINSQVFGQTRKKNQRTLYDIQRSLFH